MASVSALKILYRSGSSRGLDSKPTAGQRLGRVGGIGYSAHAAAALRALGSNVIPFLFREST